MEEKISMLKSGRYKAENDGDVFHAFRYVMNVRVTEKSYIFTLLEKERRYAYEHLETMFGGKERIVIPRNKPSRHAMRVWSDHDFTIYPLQAGIPFYFQREDEDAELNTRICDSGLATRNFTSLERMAEIANNAIDSFGELLNGRSLYDALSGSLKMSDDEILAAGFTTLKEFMTGVTCGGD